MKDFPVNRMQELFNSKIKKKLMEKFGFKNIHEVPKITKIVLSMGLNSSRDATKNRNDLSLIAGQHSVLVKAKMSVAQFQIREGAYNGAMVTLRSKLMYHLLDRIINVALLNWRSFTGLNSKSFNVQKTVSYSFGIKDKRIFPEVTDESIRDEGFNITIVSNCSKKEQLEYIMSEMGFPFQEAK